MATLKLHNSTGKWLEVKMPSATSMRYAAKRVAEAVGFDPDMGEFALCIHDTRRLIPQEDVVADYDGQVVGLMLLGFEEL